MHDIKWIREHPETFDRLLSRRNLDSKSRYLFSSKNILQIDEWLRGTRARLESALARRKVISKESFEARKRNDESVVGDLGAEAAELKLMIEEAERDLANHERTLKELLAQIHNLPLEDVPVGTDENSNELKSTFGKKREYSFKPKEHFDLGADLGMMDFELAAKLSGARFVVLQKGLARLERALGQFMLDLHTSDEHGYTEVNPPLMVRNKTMFGTAQLPKFAEDQFLVGALPVGGHLWPPFTGKIEETDTFAEAGPQYLEFFNSDASTPLWLIPTAEVPLTNLVREQIVDEDSLPRRYTACTPCFRAEAGAAGRDTRGMIRQHQFTKVELVSITRPEDSAKEHERMLACAEEVLKKLDLHYRVITLCTGDMGFASQKTCDIEVWLPGQNMYREISSCSVCGDFQARRMNARYRGKDNKPAFVHTLNGSGVAVGRALIAVMETYQQEDGSILVPDVLKPYMGGMTKIEKAK